MLTLGPSPRHPLRMTTNVPAEMFRLSEVHPALKGQWIIAMREPLTKGLGRLRRNLDGCRFAVFDHLTEFDYDGVLSSIGQIAGFRDRHEAEEHARQRCDEIAQSFLADRRWKQQIVPPRDANILPATGNRMPGSLPSQVAFSALSASEYETCYVRSYIVEAQPGSLVDQLLSNDFFANDFADHLAKLGD